MNSLRAEKKLENPREQGKKKQSRKIPMEKNQKSGKERRHREPVGATIIQS